MRVLSYSLMNQHYGSLLQSLYQDIHRLNQNLIPDTAPEERSGNDDSQAAGVTTAANEFLDMINRTVEAFDVMMRNT